MECCIIIAGQRYGPKLNEQQVSELLKFTCTRPDVRSRDIHQIMERNNYQRSALTLLRTTDAEESAQLRFMRMS